MALLSKFQLHLTLSHRYNKRFLKFISILIVVLFTIIACNNTENTKSSLVANLSSGRL